MLEENVFVIYCSSLKCFMSSPPFSLLIAAIIQVQIVSLLGMKKQPLLFHAQYSIYYSMKNRISR